ncbi:membrane-bound serine protease (ClpP class) [Bacillus oleivorans]|uniref:Membrane-bound serine protease (ClpP class) n=1 Tax=Bacillus oleivorans TaxID=1448271 RepID=A0A285CK31_9BACI|nr:nodulation protein NfeD [Bacillus oleivorans]SNX67869.1 membrane-bound serine protease (ClpP class) [Bacillus oleivorans]
MKKSYGLIVSFLLLIPLILGFGSGVKANQDFVYVVPLENTVEKGLAAFLTRAIETAEQEGARAIIFEVNTPGGAVEAASEIGNLLAHADIDTAAFVNNRALSAGAYISLYMDYLFMTPNATIGSAAIIDQAGNAADLKAQAYWLAEMENAAKHKDRDTIYAKAMADPSVTIPELDDDETELLTLTAEQAFQVGYAEAITISIDQVLKEMGLENVEIRELEESFFEKLARFLTNPIVVPILLSIGSIGLVVELYSPGFGIPGTMGLASLLLFFYGHLVAGLAGYESLILFIVGIILLLLEFFIPGGILGAIGLIAVVWGILIAGESVTQMGIYLLIAIVIAIAAGFILSKFFRKRIQIFNKIVLKESTSTEKGYISNKSRLELIGVTGIAHTSLRPAGMILVGDERIDAVTEGGYIEKGAKVKIIKAEGSRIVVREITSLDKK